MDYIFETRPYWSEIGIPEAKVRRKYIEYFGSKKVKIDSRKDSIIYLSKITGEIQLKLTNYMKNFNTCNLVRDLYKILDEAFHFYIRQKM